MFVLCVSGTALLLIAAGCGGDSSDDTTTPPPDDQQQQGWGGTDEPPDTPVESPPVEEPPPEPQPPPTIAFEDAWVDLDPPPASWTQCTEATDCQVVEIACCDHCNGGRVVAVKSRFARQAERRYRPRRCEEACTERGCAQATPVCDEQSRCTFVAEWMGGAPPEGVPVE